MKVALVHDWLTGMRGGEKCLEVACRRYPDAQLYTLLHRKNSTSPAIERMSIQTSGLQRIPAISQFYRYLLPVMPAAIERLRVSNDVDVVMSFSSCVAKGIRSPAGVPHICYCFSPMRYAWHMKDAYFPESSTKRGLIGSARSAVAATRDHLLSRIKEWDRDSSDRVTHFVANSHNVAQRIQQCYGRDSRVIHSPVDTEFYTPEAVDRQDFYLYVSALAPYKRVDLAIEACQKMGRKLVVIGSGQLLKKLSRASLKHVEILGWRTDEEIRWYLRRCRALLFPGLEDFGIVPLEAQACGAPVIAYGRGGVVETVLPADRETVGTGMFFEEQTADALCDTLLEFESNSHWISPQLSRKQAEKFSVENFERKLIDYVDLVVTEQSSNHAPKDIVPFPNFDERELRRAA